MMQDIYNDRTVYKKKMLKNGNKTMRIQKTPSILNTLVGTTTLMQRKISLNSAYGAIGNQYFRYFDLAIAEGITTAGQLSIRWIERKINQYLTKLLKTNKDYVIASDTDSIYVRFDELVSMVNPKNPIDFLDTVAKEKIEPFINKSYQHLSDYTTAYEQKMFMKREVIADKGIWTAKKKIHTQRMGC